jgi:TRAP-type mannitol/chloroaromatic compound transport system substrate-binding protein
MTPDRHPIDRRAFLRHAGGLALGGVAAAGCTPESTPTRQAAPAVHTRPAVFWRLASSFPRGLDVLFGAAEELAQRLADLTDGRFRVRPYPAGELVPGLQVLDAVQQGAVEIGHTGGYYYIGKEPALAFDTGLPFGLTARQHEAWLYHLGGLEALRPLFADFDVVNFPGGNTGAQMGGWFREPIASVGDLRGLRMRIPGLGGKVMSALGVNVQVLAAGDIYPALERGAIDATEFVGPYDDERLGFYRVARYYYYPGWWEPGPNLAFYVHRRAWEKLPADYQRAFETAVRAVAANVLAKYDARNGAALRRLRQQGVVLRRFPDDLMEAARQAATELFEQEAARNPTYRRLYEPWKRARAQLMGWFDVAEQAYAAFAFPRLGENA